jgi:uncharacterized membrane protein
MPTGMQEGVEAAIGPKLLGPGLLLGVGLGAFVDGIVLHQLLRWHHLLSAHPGVSLRANLIADGVFHAGAWLAVLGGVLWLWHRSPRADALIASIRPFVARSYRLPRSRATSASG